MARLSRDQELVERLKQRFAEYPSHEWGEQYDEQERLLYLNLCELKLTQLPPELWQFTSLQQLDLRQNQLSSLPAQLGQLTNLQKLWLHDNLLSSLPAALFQLTNLQSLDLCQNQFNSLPSVLFQLINLQELWLHTNQLSNLPSALLQLINLQILDLSSNQFSNLPTELDQLTNLQELNLSNNQLGSLPTQLSQLSNLQRLWMQNNQLSSLPTQLGQLTKLKQLDLQNNQLSSLPTQLGQLINLQRLDLRQNRLSSLPAELGQLSNLQRLWLGMNKLSSLPAELSQLTNLQKLWIQNNQLGSLPAELGQLANLQTLDLSENPQLQIPPPEVVQQGTLAVLAYLRAFPPTIERIEAKPLLVGEGDISFDENNGNQQSRRGNVPTDETSREKSMASTKETLPIKIFYCYAHEDKDLRDRIDKHLGILKRLGQVVGWYDREIQVGTEWEHEIEENLGTAHIILLLVSADFVDSDYCYGVEMTKALELHRAGQARVLPILLRPVDWQDAPFSTLQMLPTEAKPITQWKDQDEALEDVAKGIRNVVNSLRAQKSVSELQPQPLLTEVDTRFNTGEDHSDVGRLTDTLAAKEVSLEKFSQRMRIPQVNTALQRDSMDGLCCKKSERNGKNRTAVEVSFLSRV